MDSSINNTTNSSNNMQTTNSIGAIDRYFPTSPHFFDTTFLDTPNSFPTSTATTNTSTKPSTSAPGPTGRTSKKRSRASRRAPTTVLTTDTSNFRAMVQEFTGIPSPPFTSSSTSLHFPRSPCNPAPPSFLLKPFHHNFHPPPPPTSTLPPINFQSQLLNMMPQQQQQAIASSSSSGELRLPGVIGSGGDQTRQQQQDAVASSKMNFPVAMSTSVATEFHSEKGTEGLMDSWICSSD